MPGDSIVTCGEDAKLKFWKIYTTVPISDAEDSIDIYQSQELNMESLSHKESRDYKTVLSPQNRPIRALYRVTESLVAFSSHRIWFYDVNIDKIRKMFAGHNGFVTCMIFDEKRQYLISSGEDKTLRWWNIESTENVKIIRSPMINVMKIYQNEFLITGH